MIHELDEAAHAARDGLSDGNGRIIPAINQQTVLKLGHRDRHTGLNEHPRTLGMPGIIRNLDIFSGLHQSLFFRLIHQIGGHQLDQT